MAKYKTICKREVIGDTELFILRLAETGADIPYFGQIWGSSRWLSNVLMSIDLKGKKVLEIGCGLAIPTLIAAKSGARCTAIDIHEDSEEFLIGNIERNGLAGRIEFVQSDWRDFDPLASNFDLVIASDVLYAQDQSESLAQFYSKALTGTNLGIIVDPCRQYVEQFSVLLKSRKVLVERTNQFVKGMKYAELRVRKG